jgi:hypothetical protein
MSIENPAKITDYDLAIEQVASAMRKYLDDVGRPGGLGEFTINVKLPTHFARRLQGGQLLNNARPSIKFTVIIDHDLSISQPSCRQPPRESEA